MGSPVWPKRGRGTVSQTSTFSHHISLGIFTAFDFNEYVSLDIISLLFIRNKSNSLLRISTRNRYRYRISADNWTSTR